MWIKKISWEGVIMMPSFYHNIIVFNLNIIIISLFAARIFFFLPNLPSLIPLDLMMPSTSEGSICFSILFIFILFYFYILELSYGFRVFSDLDSEKKKKRFSQKLELGSGFSKIFWKFWLLLLFFSNGGLWTEFWCKRKMMKVM